MHPNQAFTWTDKSEMLDFIAEHSFAHIFTCSEAGQFVVHAPVIVSGEKLLFHVSRRNRIADQLDGRPVLISLVGRHAYHSANWYASENQVSTWHYEAVEIEGTAHRLSQEGLVSLLDQLSDTMEQRYSPENPWTRAKMASGKFEAMIQAIVGFEVRVSDIRGTRKFNQSKSDADLAATIEGQRGAGREDIVAAIEELARRAD
ncbi:MAG: FMN-binding negative transcriptional regulator [Sphingomicrobium sp.]